MKDCGCRLLLPLAVVAALAGMRLQADRLSEREAHLTRPPEFFRMHYGAGEAGRVEALDLAAAPGEPAGDDPTPHRLADAGCRTGDTW